VHTGAGGRPVSAQRWSNRPAFCGWLKILGAALQTDGEKRLPVTGLKHQKEKRKIKDFAGLDVSVNETNVCIVDEAGRIVREARVASAP
jgi:hypothetical protein